MIGLPRAGHRRADERVGQAVERLGELGQVRRLRRQLGQSKDRLHLPDLQVGTVGVVLKRSAHPRGGPLGAGCSPSSEAGVCTFSAESADVRIESGLGCATTPRSSRCRRSRCRVAELDGPGLGRRRLPGAGGERERDARARGSVCHPGGVQHQQPAGVAGDRPLGHDRAEVVQEMVQGRRRGRAATPGLRDDGLVVVEQDVYDFGVGSSTADPVTQSRQARATAWRRRSAC